MYYQILKSVLVYLQLVETKRKLLQMGYFYNLDRDLGPWTLDPNRGPGPGSGPWTLDPDPKKLDPENLDPEKPGSWKTWTLKNLDLEKPGPWLQQFLNKSSIYYILKFFEYEWPSIFWYSRHVATALHAWRVF